MLLVVNPAVDHGGMEFVNALQGPSTGWSTSGSSFSMQETD